MHFKRRTALCWVIVLFLAVVATEGARPRVMQMRAREVASESPTASLSPAASSLLASVTASKSIKIALSVTPTRTVTPTLSPPPSSTPEPSSSPSGTSKASKTPSRTPTKSVTPTPDPSGEVLVCTTSGACVEVSKVLDETLGRYVCVETPRTCEAEEVCRNYFCDDATGQCESEEVKCEGDDPCAEYFCNPETGVCDSRPKDCSGGDPCRRYLCEASTGQCIEEEKCNDGNPCTQDMCDPQTGVCANPPLCPNAGADACTKFECVPDETRLQAVCVEVEKCVSPSKCSTATCKKGVCSFEFKCSPPSLCKNVTCNEEAGLCEYIDRYESSDPCLYATCDYRTGLRSKDQPKCRPFDECTPASCEAGTGTCGNTSACYVDDSPCFSRSCVGGKCLNISLCDDKNPCTVDSCIWKEGDPLEGEYCLHEPSEDGIDCMAGRGSCYDSKCLKKGSFVPRALVEPPIFSENSTLPNTDAEPPNNSTEPSSEDPRLNSQKPRHFQARSVESDQSVVVLGEGRELSTGEIVTIALAWSLLPLLIAVISLLNNGGVRFI